MKSRNHINVSLDRDTLALLHRRAETCDGNRSKAVRTYIQESVDQGMRLRRSIRTDLNVITRALGILRRSYRIPGTGVIIEDIDKAVRSIEEKVAKVTTS